MIPDREWRRPSLGDNSCESKLRVKYSYNPLSLISSHFERKNETVYTHQIDRVTLTFTRERGGTGERERKREVYRVQSHE